MAYFEDWNIQAKSAGIVEYTDCVSAEGLRLPTNECPRYDARESDGETPVMLELWVIRSTPSLPLLPGPLWRGVVAPESSYLLGETELFDI